MSVFTNIEKQYAKTVLQNMDLPEESLEDIFAHQGSEWTVEEHLNDFTYEGEPLFESFNFGATKNVLYFNSHHPNNKIRYLASKMVIKVPMMYDEDYDEPFTNAARSVYAMNDNLFDGEEPYIENESDYCNTEAEIYRYMTRRDCYQPLAETFFLCTVDDYPFYGAEKVEPLDDFASDYYKKPCPITSKDEGYKELVRSSYDFEEELLKFDIAATYSLKIALSLLYFCGKIEVSDVYPSRNCGIDKLNRTKIIDYSSYNED